MGDQVNYEVTVTVSTDTLETTDATTDAEQFVDDWGTHACYDLVFTIDTQDISTALGAMKTCPQQTSKTA